jgi:dihydrofolate synthase/folylpolyglutamate synthase
MVEKDRVIKELYAQAFFGEKAGLENMKKMCESFGHPERSGRIIHLAGTNGKGSTATAIEKILLEAGYRVGKFTSPHILEFNERIKLNGENISDEDLIKYYNLVKEKWQELKLKPTFFEIATMMMFKYFSDKGVDFIVLETGLGGRLDATNIAKGEIVIITNISLDHQEILGHTLLEIAREKAGIIKPNSKVIVGDSCPELREVVLEKTGNYIDVLKKYGEDGYTLNYKNFLTEVVIEDKKYEFSLFGSHQYKNFLCAYETLKILGISDKIIKRGAKKVVWECRFEIFSQNPLVILDGAHNIDGVKNLKEIISKQYSPEDVVIITSILKDKEVGKMLPLLSEISNEIILTSIQGNSRGMLGDEIYNLLEEKEKFKVENELKKAYKMAVEADKKLILICGSFYLLSKFKEEFVKWQF